MNELSQLLAVSIATVVLPVQSLLYGIFLACFFANLYLRISNFQDAYFKHWVLSVVRFSREVLSGLIPTEAALLPADNSQKNAEREDYSCTVAVAHLFARSSVEHNLFYTSAGGRVTVNYVLTMMRV
ncbi:hypothetical protein B0H13DRAFT_1897382 [Mycena leptocephala]|nr:hypothetical protein B0H13DRAFT_1897382 [Mycena leptocephala]